MAPDWSRFVNNANAQAPTPATSTGPANVTELTFHLLNRGYFRFEDIYPRVPITRDMLDVKCMQAKEFVQQWKSEGKAGTPMQGSTLYVIQQTAALQRVATHAPLILRQSTQHDELYHQAPACRRCVCGVNKDLEYDIDMQDARNRKPYVIHRIDNGHHDHPSRREVPALPSSARPCHKAAISKDTLEDLDMQMFIVCLQLGLMMCHLLQGHLSPLQLSLMNRFLPPRINHLHLGVMHPLPGGLFISQQPCITHCLVSCLQLYTLRLQLGCELGILGPQHYHVVHGHLSRQQLNPLNFLKPGLQWYHLLLGILSRLLSCLQPALQLDHLLLGILDSLLSCLQLTLQLGQMLPGNLGCLLGSLQPNLEPLELRA
ncbi:hypothetical protein V8C86DRAFT_2443859 [Haematococcus lacustris]